MMVSIDNSTQLIVTAGSGGDEQTTTIVFNKGNEVGSVDDTVYILDEQGKTKFKFLYTDFSPTPANIGEVVDALNTLILAL